jgi:hypothetical protein
MNDKKILDRVLLTLEHSGWIGEDGDYVPFDYLDIKFEPPFLSMKEKKPDDERWMELKGRLAKWILEERAEEALNEKIRSEVKKQIKILKY